MWEVDAGGWETCVDRRPGCPGRQRPKEATQREEDEEKRRKETRRGKRRELWMSTVPPTSNLWEGATRWQSGLIRREPLILSSNSKWKCPQQPPFKFHPVFRLPVPQFPQTQNVRTIPIANRLVVLSEFPFWLNLRPRQLCHIFPAPTPSRRPQSNCELHSCRRIASAIIPIDSRRLRPLKPPDLVWTSPSKRLPVIPSIASQPYTTTTSSPIDHLVSSSKARTLPFIDTRLVQSSALVRPLSRPDLRLR